MGDDGEAAERRLLAMWQKSAQEYSRVHRRAALVYKRTNLLFMVPIICFSSLSGAGNFLALPFEEDRGVQYAISSVLGCMSIAAAILTALHNTMGIADLQTQHSDYSAEFSKLARDISVELLITNTKERVYVSLGEFIKQVQERMNRLIERAPMLPSRVSYESAAGEPPGPAGEGVPFMQALQARFSLERERAEQRLGWRLRQGGERGHGGLGERGHGGPQGVRVVGDVEAGLAGQAAQGGEVAG